MGRAADVVVGRGPIGRTSRRGRDGASVALAVRGSGDRRSGEGP